MLEMTVCHTRLRGFSLVELLITLAVASVLMMVAVPSFTAFQRNSELTSQANSLVAAINAARSEGIKRGRNALLVPADNAAWSSGWQVFVDANRNYTYNQSTDTLVFTREAPPSYITITASTGSTAVASPPYVMFDAQGYTIDKSPTFVSLVFTIARNDATTDITGGQTRRVIVSKTGRARVCNPSKDTSCTTTATQ